MRVRYAGIMRNDVVDGIDFSVSFWSQGCPHRCKGCHNPETWDFNGGYEEDLDKIKEGILSAIEANGIERNFSVLGGEPLCDNMTRKYGIEPSNVPNINITYEIIKTVREKHKNIKIFLWTGYEYDELQKIIKIGEEEYPSVKYYKYILENIDYLIDGRYIEEKRDVTLFLRGSSNQRIINMKTGKIVDKEDFK